MEHPDDPRPAPAAPQTPRANDEKTPRSADDAQSMRYTAMGLLAIALEFGVATAVGFYAGRWLDAYFGTRPWLMIALVIGGALVAFRDLVRVARRAMRDAEE